MGLAEELQKEEEARRSAAAQKQKADDMKKANEEIARLPERVKSRAGGYVTVDIGYKTFSREHGELVDSNRMDEEAVDKIKDWAKKEGFECWEYEHFVGISSCSSTVMLIIEWVDGSFASWRRQMAERREERYTRREARYERRERDY